ncbi:MAG TPA: hypothetical protein VM222_03025, partial [Planctomycetota bacterium]|nr:hypothetical protein [Planctomycetota bacterium]
METSPELTEVERYLRLLIDLTEKGSFDELAERHYHLKPSRKKDAAALLKRNQKGHLKMLKWVLSNRSEWILLKPIDKVMALMGNSDIEYPDDGLWFNIAGGGAITEPFGDSVAFTRKAEKLKPEIRTEAAKAGISPFVYKEVLRLKGSFPQGEPRDAIAAFRAIDWGSNVEFNTPESDEESLVCGFTFVAEYPSVPEGFGRDKRVAPIGNDCYKYFGLVANERDPLDPIVVSIDHEEEASEPFEDTFLSIWLARL